jgi:nucleoid-associated protein YgaU
VDEPSETETVLTEPAEPSPELLDGLRAARARAEAARKRAADFETPSYFPSDWEIAGEQYAAADALPVDADAEVRAAIDAHDAAAGTFDDLFDKAVALYAQRWEDDISAARSECIAAGLTGAVPEYLRAADNTAVAALGQYEAKDYYTARDSAAQALAMYETLKAGADTWQARQEVVDQGFDQYDSARFAQADDTALAAVDAYDNGDLETARGLAGEARRRYNQALDDGWAVYAAARAEAAQKARQTALDNRADETARDMFNDAEAKYSQAVAALDAGHYQDAAAGYTEAEDRFMRASQAAARERDAVAPLPAQYTVRFWENFKDCLWNIAGRPWAYGDPYQWQRLYNANRAKLSKPDNPDLIEPGTVLDIPSIRGEARQGMWDPDKTYAPLP